LTKARPSKTYRVSSISCHTVFLVKVKFLKWKIVALAATQIDVWKMSASSFHQKIFQLAKKTKKCKTKIQVNETRKPLQNYAPLANTLHNSLSLPHTFTHTHTHTHTQTHTPHSLSHHFHGASVPQCQARYNILITQV